MAEKVKVNLYGDEIEVERGTTLLELAKQYQCKEDNDIILAVVNCLVSSKKVKSIYV